MTEYQQERYNKLLSVLDELNANSSIYKFELDRNQEEPDRSTIMLKGLVPIGVNYNDYEKSYGFFLRFNLPYVRYDTEKQVMEKYQKPQNVGVLTENKIKAWCEFLIKVYEDMLEISKQRLQEVNEFEAKMAELGAKIGNKDPYGSFDGRVVKNGLEFKFTVHNEGYISREILVSYEVSDTVENFLKLSDNKYTEA